jgi:SAM-dependent methyltransferase/uncharacterized protein YbaR (Trm112 family)
MRRYLLDKLVCPRCDHFPLALDIKDERECPDIDIIVRPCDVYCAFREEWLQHCSIDPPCSQCFKRRIWIGELICLECHTHYMIREGIPDFLTDGSVSDWVSAEQGWWEHKYAQVLKEKNIAHLRRATDQERIAGNRLYERNKYLFDPLRRRGILGKSVLEIGVGMAETVANLLRPGDEYYFYIGTDVAAEALQIASRLLPEADFVRCAAGNMPFRKRSFDHILCLGVLHHIPEWQTSTEQVLDLLKPGGWMLMSEAIAKPRILGRFRKESLTAAMDSPHEGEVAFDELLEIGQRKGRFILTRVQMTPLRVLLVWIVGGWMNRSLLLTTVVLAADQMFCRTLGRLFKSLGPGELLGVIEKEAAHER